MKDVLHDKGYESGSCWHKAKVLVLTSEACLCLFLLLLFIIFNFGASLPGLDTRQTRAF